MKILVTTLISWLILSLSQNLHAEQKAVDAVVIMDSSGSMKKNDPNSLRKPAAKLFISLLNETDRASIMSFSDNGYPITYLNTLDSEKNIQMTLKATDKVSTKGVYTNIHAAVERAHKILTENPSDRDPIIILLSDGKMDVGNNKKSIDLSSQLISETVPKLNAANIKVYSIAFTEGSDQDLLTTLSESTEGFCKVAANDEELHTAFTSIFEQSKQPDMLPLSENSFLADESIREITIVANKATPESKIFLQNPDDEKFDATVDNKNIKWFISDSFDMITIKKPLPGDWKILFSDNDNKAYIVADMKMQSKFDFIEENGIKKLHAQAWLEKEEQTVSEPTILDSITAKLELSAPSETVSESPMGLALNDENMSGIFISNYKPKENGTYFATVTLKSQTFERQKTFSFVSELPPEPIEKAVPEADVATESADKEKPAESEPEPKEKTETAAEEEPEEDNTLQSILIFVAVNILIAIIGLSIFLVLKLKKAKTAATEKEEEK